jgi:hypothetical protein
MAVGGEDAVDPFIEMRIVEGKGVPRYNDTTTLPRLTHNIA